MRSLRVILSIDALHLPLTGIGWYTLELANGMLDHPDIESLLFTNGRRFPMVLPDLWPSADDHRNAPAGKVAKARYPGFVLPALRAIRGSWGRVQAVQSRQKLERSIDHICHGPNYSVPRRTPRRMNTATIHDLSILRYPALHPPRRVAFMNAQLPKTIEHCERIIVSSQAVAHEVAVEFRIALERISVVPLGVRSVFSDRVGVLDTEYQAAVGVQAGCYFLFVNGADPRKNLVAALKAFRAYRQEVAPEMRLLVTAPPSSVSTLAAALTGEEGVLLVSYPDELTLAALYRGAAGLLFPSLYEGFGLPVVEALASGTPVLVSRAETLLEFVGLPGVKAVNAGDTDDFSQGLIDLGTAQLTEGAKLGAGAVAERFAWKHCVNRTIESYSLFS